MYSDQTPRLSNGFNSLEMLLKLSVVDHILQSKGESEGSEQWLMNKDYAL